MSELGEYWVEQEGKPVFPPDFYTRYHAGIEGIRSASDPEWDWSQRSETLQRSGPSAAVKAKVKELTRVLGTPPEDLEMYGEFDEREDIGGEVAAADGIKSEE